MTAELPRRTSDFDYQLPPDLIAQEPLPDRAASRLLVVRRHEGGAGSGTLSDSMFHHLPDLIPPGDVVVVNTTKVRHARLIGRRASGAPAEVLLIHPATDGAWVALGKPGSALRPGKRVVLDTEVWVEVERVLPSGHRIVRIHGTTPDDAMRRFGRVPLPPYIAREPTATDATRYQTVYAEREGSVAAPTAGLHFTPTLLERLRGQGIGLIGIDLEVGPGTFQPVEAEFTKDHAMHPERFEIPPATAARIADARSQGAKIWAVGTTVVRALESAAVAGTVQAGRHETRLLIIPGYHFRVVDRLVTNFHLPRSTLLMLVSAFAGFDLIRQAYRHAIAQRYRFYSYGDAMVII
ncbi:MAG TPA: tRNA preQ1(34) S-adenosylmethionine ribosyltransferase-isomerase QueA [Gemmatimonadales bacterium]|nr:tRNA preQ1(34) S-adenosylmethionine ribosyltransferase-isomerase QueA [Gemmatimonadales bacterium]